MLLRLRNFILQFLIAIDSLTQTLIVGIFYLIGLAKCPAAHETISSYVGRASISGKYWGIALEVVIDDIFYLLGTGSGHCRRNVQTAFLGLAPVA